MSNVGSEQARDKQTAAWIVAHRLDLRKEPGAHLVQLVEDALREERGRLASTLEALQRENEALREALKEIRDEDSYEKRESFDDSGKHITRTVYGELGEIANSALASAGEEHHAE